MVTTILQARPRPATDLLALCSPEEPKQRDALKWGEGGSRTQSFRHLQPSIRPLLLSLGLPSPSGLHSTRYTRHRGLSCTGAHTLAYMPSPVLHAPGCHSGRQCVRDRHVPRTPSLSLQTPHASRALPIRCWHMYSSSPGGGESAGGARV